MKKLLILTLLLAMAETLSAAVSLTELYSQIDDAIAHSNEYVAEYEERISKVKDAYRQEASVDRKFELAIQLYELYKAYNNDSALSYIGRCITWAEDNHRPEMAGHARALMAFQCSTSGMYIESRDLLQKTAPALLTPQGRSAYYFAWMHLCGEIAYYSKIDHVQQHYYSLQSAYRDSVLNNISPTSLDYLMLRQTILLNDGQLNEALKVNDTWQNAVAVGSHEHAIAAFYRNLVYDRMGRTDEAKICLAESALDDIRCAVMDQASLITLASLLNSDGDFQRSYQYLRFTWDCNNRFSTRMRTWQISPIMTLVENNYQQAIEQNIQRLTTAFIVAGVLALLLLLALVYVARQRSRYKQARNEVKSAYDQLSATNEKLQLMNDLVVGYNKELFEIKHQLEEANRQLTGNKPIAIEATQDQ